MKFRLLLTIICACVCLSINAQDANNKLTELFENNAYKEVTQLAKEKQDISDTDAYHIGLSYYHLEDDKNALTYFDKAIELNSSNPEYHFYKGICLMYTQQYQLSLAAFDNSISLSNVTPVYHIGKGDAYYNLKQLDSALVCYQKAITLPLCPSRAYTMNAQVLGDMRKPDASLKAYYLAKENIDPFTVEYLDALYNIGVQEYLLANYDKSAEAFSTLLDLSPYDYQSIAKMIQVQYAINELEAAATLKEKLYHGYQKKELPENLKEMFCFDQFSWQDYLVLAFERYHESANELYYKHIFYLVDTKGDIKIVVQTEYSPSIAASGNKYVLGKKDETGHQTYFDFMYKEDFDYNDLKKGVIHIFADNTTPLDTSSMPKKKKKKKKRKPN